MNKGHSRKQMMLTLEFLLGYSLRYFELAYLVMVKLMGGL